MSAWRSDNRGDVEQVLINLWQLVAHAELLQSGVLSSVAVIAESKEAITSMLSAMTVVPPGR